MRKLERRRPLFARVLGLIAVVGLPLTSTALVDHPVARPDLAALALSTPSPSPSPDPITAAASIDGYTPAAPLRDSAKSGVEVPPQQLDGTTGKKMEDDPRCGRGFTSVSRAAGVVSCFHTVPDPLPDIAQPAARAATAAPVCMGNGVNGPRIQLIYMYVEGQPDRTAQVVPRILNQIVPYMEGAFRETSKSQGREIGMRLHMPGCKPTVDTVRIDRVRGEPDDGFVMHGRIADALTEAGYVSTDRKFVLWFDGGNGVQQDGKVVSRLCGVAPGYTAVLEQGLNPTPANTSNIGWQRVMPNGEVAVAYRYGIPILGDAPIPPPPPPRWPGDSRPAPPPEPECWGRGAMGARTETHELLHLLGAVGLSAPNSNGYGHCVDDIDIMCYGERGVMTTPRCASPVELLDCGADDYFNARPQAGSYLSRAWNTANSRFLGDAIVHDAVPIEIPRP